MEQTQRLERALRLLGTCADEVSTADNHFIDDPDFRGSYTDWVRDRDRALALLDESARLLQALRGAAAWHESRASRQPVLADPSPDPTPGSRTPDRRAAEQAALAGLRSASESVDGGSGAGDRTVAALAGRLAAVEKGLAELRTEVCGRPGSGRLGLIHMERQLSERVLRLEQDEGQRGRKAAELKKIDRGGDRGAA